MLVNLIGVPRLNEFRRGILSDANVDCLGFVGVRVTPNAFFDIDILRVFPICVKSVIVSVCPGNGGGGWWWWYSSWSII